MLRRVLFLCVTLMPARVLAFECGDVLGNGDGVKASDALGVLQKAVGLDSQLACETGDCIAIESRVSSLEAGNLYLFDNNANLFGRVVSTEFSHYTVWVGELQRLLRLEQVLLQSGETEIRSSFGNNLEVRYEQPNCQGQPILIGFDPQFLTYVLELHTDSWTESKYAIVSPSGVQKGVIATQSKFDGSKDTCQNAERVTTPDQVWMLPTIVDLPVALPAEGPIVIVPGGS